MNLIKHFLYPIIDLFTFRQLPWLIFFRKVDNWSIYQLRRFQLEKLSSMGINSWNEFYKQPITSKKDLPNKPLTETNSLYHETSGSTGEPRKIWVPKDTWARKDAIFSRSWEKMGRKSGDWVFRLMSGEPKYKWYDWWRNVYPTNYKTLSDKTVEEFVKIKPKFIHGPGGSIRQLIERLINAGHKDLLKDVSVEWCSESFEGHKERIQPLVKAFHAQYGLAELPTVGSPDGYGNIKVVMEQGIVEIVDDNGDPVPMGEEGFIIVTDFNNTLTPIIRYKSGDRGKMAFGRDPKTGWLYYILYDIIGRGVDYYNGPEVKKEIGWSIVAPISHILGDVISKWKIEVRPKEGKAILYVKWVDGPQPITDYEYWVEDTYGLRLEVAELEDEKYDIYFKNRLVKVVE